MFQQQTALVDAIWIGLDAMELLPRIVWYLIQALTCGEGAKILVPLPFTIHGTTRVTT